MRCLALLAMALAGVACGGSGDAGGQAEVAPPPATYTSRAEVLEVTPEALTLHHEAIDDYRGADGVVRGMDAMAMRFVPREGLATEDLAPGDRIRFRFEARAVTPRFVVTEVHKLAEGTTLDYRAARPTPGQ